MILRFFLFGIEILKLNSKNNFYLTLERGSRIILGFLLINFEMKAESMVARGDVGGWVGSGCWRWTDGVGGGGGGKQTILFFFIFF